MSLVAANEIPREVPLAAHDSLAVVLSTEDSLFLFIVLPSFPPGFALPSLSLQLFPRNTRVGELQTKLLSPLASLYMSDEVRFR